MRIFSFATPTRERAGESKFYDWMFNGERVYSALVDSFRFLKKRPPLPTVFLLKPSPTLSPAPLIIQMVVSI
jgi:hypothetical protein